MREEIAFENGRISDFQGLVTLTLDRVILHTVMHHLSTSTYMPNFMKIETFCERTNGRRDGRFSTHVIRSTRRSRPKNKVKNKIKTNKNGNGRTGWEHHNHRQCTLLLDRTQCTRCGLLLQMSHVTWSVCLSVCWSLMYCGKTTKSIEMPLGDWLIWWQSRSQREWEILGVIRPTEKYWESAAVYAAKWIIQSSTTAWYAMRPFTKIH